MDTEKKVFQYMFLILFAAMTSYTFLLRTAFYNEEGLPRQPGVLRVMGENLAGDYALFRLLENKTPPQEAYQSEKVSRFLYKTAHIDNYFVSFASPMKSFVFVPWLSVPYDGFCETWIFWGIFLFGIALYSLFPVTKALLLMFALPAGFLSFITGGWGIYAAAGVILTLSLAEKHPKWAGFFGALCVIEPVTFVLVAAALIVRRQTKAAVFCVAGALAVVSFSAGRYGADAFGAALSAAVKVLQDRPCIFSSLFALLNCSGVSFAASVVLQTLLTVAVLYGAVRLMRKQSCPPAVQNAYLCAAGCLISPFFGLADFGLLYAGVAFLIKDSEQRGFLKGDFWFFTAAFASIYFENFFLQLTGAPFQPVLAVWLLLTAYRRRY